MTSFKTKRVPFKVFFNEYKFMLNNIKKGDIARLEESSLPCVDGLTTFLAELSLGTFWMSEKGLWLEDIDSRRKYYMTMRSFRALMDRGLTATDSVIAGQWGYQKNGTTYSIYLVRYIDFDDGKIGLPNGRHIREPPEK